MLGIHSLEWGPDVHMIMLSLVKYLYSSIVIYKSLCLFPELLDIVYVNSAAEMHLEK